ncbi:MAG: hypothetical protein Q9213_001777 [Squamulea squamosa]
MAPQLLLFSINYSTGMSELKRKVTTLSGGGVKPLRLEEYASARHDDRVELKEGRHPRKTLHKRILPVNDNRSSFDLRPPEEKPVKKAKLVSEDLDVTTEFHEFMVFDQGGPATIGSSNTRENFLVAIKRRRVPGFSAKSAYKHPAHDNIVSLFELFYEGDEVCMDNGTITRLELFVKRLKLPHSGALLIHLANIGDSIVEQRDCTDEKAQEDTRCLGFIMVELMEPTTYALNSRTIELEHPARWKANTGLKEFLASTASSSLTTLAQVPLSNVFLPLQFELTSLQDVFLPRESIRNCLRPDVFRTLISANIDWELLPPSRIKQTRPPGK